MSSNIAYIKLLQGKDGQWYYEPRSANNETLSTSEGYTSKEDAARAAQDAYPDREITEAP